MPFILSSDYQSGRKIAQFMFYRLYSFIEHHAMTLHEVASDVC